MIRQHPNQDLLTAQAEPMVRAVTLAATPATRISGAVVDTGAQDAYVAASPHPLQLCAALLPILILLLLWIVPLVFGARRAGRGLRFSAAAKPG